MDRLRSTARLLRTARRSRPGFRIAARVALVTVLGVSLMVVVQASEASAAAGDPVIAIGGDIACAPGKSVNATHCQQAKTGDVLTTINPSVVLPLGDEQYESASTAELAGSYNVTQWGAKKGISRPAAGNHEYHTPGAADYYSYFGSNAGDPSKGYYSYDIPVPGGFRWHMIVLNSECSDVGGCKAGSPQEAWLRADLAANPGLCTAAYWHRPRFSSSSTTPSSTTYTAFWNDLFNAGADLVLNGHAHDYERFAPQTGSGSANPAGLTEFIVGTGGDNFQSMGSAVANSVIRNNSAFGALKMTLHSGSYDWQFMPAVGYSLSDSGSANCHNQPVGGTPPGMPTGLSASAPTARQVNLSWTAGTGSPTSYNIFRGANGATPTLLTTTTDSATNYSDTSAIENTPYTYTVQAINAAGQVSPMSDPASVTTPPINDSTPPTTPTNLQTEDVSGGEIDLSWTASTDTGTGVSGYRVYRGPYGPHGTTPQPTQLATTTGTGVSYQDLTTSPNTRYVYQVVAFDGAGNNSDPSNMAIAATPPGPATQTYTFPSTGDATIDQANPTTNYGLNTRLVVDHSPVNDFLVKFDVNAPQCPTISAATLRLTVGTSSSDGSAVGGDFYTTGSGWNETAVNWNSAPGRGTFLNTLAAVTSGTTYTVNVTSGVTTSNGEVDFRIGSTNNDGARYFSKDGSTAAQRPQLSVTCTGSSTDTLAPTEPTNLTATAANAGEVDLDWTQSTDNLNVTGYRIYRSSPSGTTPLTLVGSTAGTAFSYQDITVNQGTSYDYQVTAVDAANNESVASDTATATTPTLAPEAPTGLDATPVNDGEIDLAWTASAGSPAATDYSVYRGLAGQATTKIADSTGGATTFADMTADAGTAYDYQVTGVDAGAHESDKSNTATATTPALGPAPPTDLGATAAGDDEIDLSWTASSGLPAAIEYNVYRAPAGGLMAKIDTASLGATTYEDTTAHAGTSYDYRVSGVGADTNEGAKSNSATATTTDTEAPDAPTDLGATAVNSGRVDLSWTASQDNVAVTGYNIYRGPAGGATAQIASPAGVGTTFSDTTADPDTSYDYQVTAVDAATNESGTSNPATATTPAAAPAAPTGLGATAVNSGRVDLSWTASAGSPAAAHYNIYRGPIGGATTMIASPAGPGTTFSDTTAAPATGYDYQVTAVDATSHESGKSNRASATTPAAPPQIYTFPSVGDARISQTNGTTNYGSTSTLVVDNSPVDDSLVQFNVATTGCTTVNSATLRLTVNADGSVKGGDFYATGSGWSEGTVTWNTAPARGTLLGTLGAVTSGSTYTVTVTGGVTTLNGLVSFRIGSTNNDGVHYYPKEAGTAAQKPQLTVTCT